MCNLMINHFVRGGRRALWLGVVLLVLFGAQLGVRSLAQDNTSNNRLEFTILDVEGVKRLFDEAKGKVVVINFWATWCPPCVEEMPELAKFYKDYADRGVTFLSFSADHPTTIDEAVRPFVQKHKLPFPVYILDIPNPDDLARALDMADWNGGLPGTFIYDSERKLIHYWVQEITYVDLTAIIDPLLSEK